DVVETSLHLTRVPFRCRGGRVAGAGLVGGCLTGRATADEPRPHPAGPCSPPPVPGNPTPPSAPGRHGGWPTPGGSPPPHPPDSLLGIVVIAHTEPHPQRVAGVTSVRDRG